VFPARYELNSYIVFRKRLVSKRLSVTTHLTVSTMSVVWTVWRIEKKKEKGLTKAEDECVEVTVSLVASVCTSMYTHKISQ
jgi:hypothetical protein